MQRLICLSGLDPDGALSTHLAPRVKVGEILEPGTLPTLTFQAGLIIGSGSASFEMVRHLTDAPTDAGRQRAPAGVSQPPAMAAAEIPFPHRRGSPDLVKQ